MSDVVDERDEFIEEVLKALVKVVNKQSDPNMNPIAIGLAQDQIEAHYAKEIEKADLVATIKAAKEIWAVYEAPSRVLGEKMFDFDKWLPGQIKDWEAQLQEEQHD